MANYKNNYTSKLRKRILKEKKTSNKKFTTNYKDIKKYFKYFNNLLFKDKLNNFNDIKIKIVYFNCLFYELFF